MPEIQIETVAKDVIPEYADELARVYDSAFTAAVQRLGKDSTPADTPQIVRGSHHIAELLTTEHSNVIKRRDAEDRRQNQIQQNLADAKIRAEEERQHAKAIKAADDAHWNEQHNRRVKEQELAERERAIMPWYKRLFR